MPNQFLIETHAHTAKVSPCGRLSPRRLVEGYVNAGYSGIVITDHLTATLPIYRRMNDWSKRVRRFFSGFRDVQKAADGTGLNVYPGFELTFADFPGNDFLVYGIDEPMLRKLPDVYSMPPAEFKSAAADLGALVFQAHPYRNTGPLDPSLVDGLEVCNCNPRHDSQNDLAAAFAEEHDLLAIGGSDAHREEDIARGGIILPELPGSLSELVAWMKGANGPFEILAACESTIS